MIKLSDYVFQFVAETLGVDHVFLLPGGGCMHLVDSLGRQRGLEYTACLHEQAVVFCADAHAQVTGKMGVALVTTGPGGTNALTGVAASWIDSTPLLVISGQAKRADLMGTRGVRQMGIQEVDVVSMAAPITKYAATVMEPASIRRHLEQAAYQARAGRPGPVWVDIPLDVQGATIDEEALEGFDAPQDRVDDEQVQAAVARAAELLQGAERPVILVGNGVRHAGAIRELLAWAERDQIPLLTTWKSIDFLPEDHPLFFGRPGSIGQRGANFIQQNADLIFCLGARLDLAQVAFSYPGFAPAARKVVLDADPAEIAKIDTEVTLPLAMDAAPFLRGMLSADATEARQEWLSRCRSWKEAYPVMLPRYREEEGPVNTYVLVDLLSELLGPDDLLVPGSSGSCAEITMQAFRIKAGQRVFNTPGLGAMGSGLPASLGAAIAARGRRVVTIIGDGGLQHNIQELETIARVQPNLKILILNNNGYASIRTTHNRHFDGRLVCCDPQSGLTLPDTCKVAAAYGLPTGRVHDHQELAQELPGILDTPGPCIWDVVVQPDLPTAPRIASEVRPDGSIVSKPMEDLWPFLDREEFEENMITAPKPGRFD